MSAEDLRSHFLTKLDVIDAFSVRDLEIPIAGTGPGTQDSRHLLLTGPNGSGKSTILRGLEAELLAPGQRRLNEGILREQQARNQRQLVSLPPSDPRRTGLAAQRNNLSKALAKLATTGHVKARFGPHPSEEPFILRIPADRTLQLQPTNGPKPLNERVFARGNVQVGQTLQHLVNLKTEAALARDDGAGDEALALSERLSTFEEGLQTLFDDDGARLTFDRHTLSFSLESRGKTTSFEHLPDGLSSATYIWSGLTLASEGQRRRGDVAGRGWALLDEPELHLHAELQEKLLPFLAASFPNVQFIVATHSPAILASLPGATVFDLRTREGYPSEELRGIRYGTILTEHFGISSDFDLETTRALEQLYELYDSNPKPGSEAFKQMRRLADSLGEVPHVLVSAARKLTSRASDSDD